MGIESPLHLLFLGAVALIVLGPKRLPELARALGKGIREFRGAFDEAAAPQPVAAPAPPQEQTTQQLAVVPMTAAVGAGQAGVPQGGAPPAAAEQAATPELATPGAAPPQAGPQQAATPELGAQPAGAQDSEPAQQGRQEAAPQSPG